MKRIKFWVLVSAIATFSLVFAVCQSSRAASPSFNIEVIGGSADVEAAPAGQTITLTPDSQADKAFTGWTIDPPAVIMTSANQFIMPSFNVTVTGEFDDASAGKIPYFITNNYAQDSSSGFMVKWHNDTDVTEQTIQVVKAGLSFGDADDIQVAGEVFESIGNGTCPSPISLCSNAACTGTGNYPARNIFKTTVADLEPATLYKYRIGTPGTWSNIYYHLTSGGTGINRNFSFTVVTDTQNNVFNVMRTTLRTANEFDADNRFFLIAGDIVESIGLNPSEIENYTKAASEFNIARPIAVTQGNHDTYHNKVGHQFVFGEATIFNAYVTFPDNGFEDRFDGPNRSKSYYFYYNDVLIVMLNTFATQGRTGITVPNHAAQASWLKEILEYDKANKLSKFRIIATHIPAFGGRGSGDDREPWLTPDVRAAYGKICTDYNVDIFFAGHEHVYARSNPIKIGANTALASINYGPTPGGTIYSIAGSTGPKFYDFRNPTGTANQFIPLTYPVKFDQSGISPGMFINVKVTEKKLTVTAKRVNADGVLDAYEVPVKK